MKIRLAVDVDGVLADSFSMWHNIAYKEGVQDPFDHKYNGIYKVRCSDGEIFANKLFSEYRDQWILESKVFGDVPDFIERINSHDDITWWVVTSRQADVTEQTKQWLKNSNIDGYEDVLFLPDKTQAACNVLIDDKPSHVLDYQNQSRLGYLISRSYNLSAEGIAYRMDDLDQTYNHLIQFL